MSLQEELTELHRKRSENASHVLSLSAKLTEKETELSTTQTQLAGSVAKCADLEDQISFMQSKVQEYGTRPIYLTFYVYNFTRLLLCELGWSIVTRRTNNFI